MPLGSQHRIEKAGWGKSPRLGGDHSALTQLLQGLNETHLCCGPPGVAPEPRARSSPQTLPGEEAQSEEFPAHLY